MNINLLSDIEFKEILNHDYMIDISTEKSSAYNSSLDETPPSQDSLLFSTDYENETTDNTTSYFNLTIDNNINSNLHSLNFVDNLNITQSNHNKNHLSFITSVIGHNQNTICSDSSTDNKHNNNNKKTFSKANENNLTN